MIVIHINNISQLSEKTKWKFKPTNSDLLCESSNFLWLIVRAALKQIISDLFKTTPEEVWYPLGYGQGWSKYFNTLPYPTTKYAMPVYFIPKLPLCQTGTLWAELSRILNKKHETNKRTVMFFWESAIVCHKQKFHSLTRMQPWKLRWRVFEKVQWKLSWRSSPMWPRQWCLRPGLCYRLPWRHVY